jgi:hypothetical protein
MSPLSLTRTLFVANERCNGERAYGCLQRLTE